MLTHQTGCSKYKTDIVDNLSVIQVAISLVLLWFKCSLSLSIKLPKATIPNKLNDSIRAVGIGAY